MTKQVFTLSSSNRNSLGKRLAFFNIEHNWNLKPINSSMELNQHKVYCTFCSNSFWNWHHFSIDSFDSFDSSDAFVLNVLLLILCVNSGILFYFPLYYVFLPLFGRVKTVTIEWLISVAQRMPLTIVDGHFAWIWLILNETNAIRSCTQW